MEENQEVRNLRKEKVGVVVSDKMQKTVVVKVDSLVKHQLYNKYIKRSVKYKVHDEQNVCKVGDRVQIIECRPLSKDKRWSLKQVIESIS
jgi:small subunit ribosomal protein S17